MTNFELSTLHDYNDAAILDEIRRVADINGRKNLTRTFFDNHAKVHSSTIGKRFGGWSKALNLAGIGHLVSPTARQVDKNEIIQLAQEIANKIHSKNLTQKEFSFHTGIGQKAILARFQKWGNVLDAAGLVPAALGRRYTDEECFNNILELWTHHGRQPAFTELNRPPSKVGSRAYIIRWGGWRTALQSFIERVNAEQKDEETSISSDDNLLPEAPISDKIRASPPRSITFSTRYKVLARDHFRCVGCGRSPAKDPSVELHIDHIVAWSRGGNLVTRWQ